MGVPNQSIPPKSNKMINFYQGTKRNPPTNNQSVSKRLHHLTVALESLNQTYDVFRSGRKQPHKKHNKIPQHVNPPFKKKENASFEGAERFRPFRQIVQRQTRFRPWPTHGCRAKRRRSVPERPEPGGSERPEPCGFDPVDVAELDVAHLGRRGAVAT